MKAAAAMAESAAIGSPGSAAASADHVGDRMGCFEPGLHVGEAMFEGLVRRERTTERVAIEGPLDGHVERRLHRPDGFRGGDRATDEQAPVDVVSSCTRLADHRAEREANVGELDAAVSP